MRRWQVGAAAILGAVAILAGSGGALADGHDQRGDHFGVCTGGMIGPGSYERLVVAGACSIPSGTVQVEGNLVIRPGALLDATTPNSFPEPGFPGTLKVGGNIVVQRGAVLILGCGFSLTSGHLVLCSGSTLQRDRVGGNITAVDALAVVIHEVTVDGNVSIIGGGGGPAIADLGGRSDTPPGCYLVAGPAPWSSDPVFSHLPVYSTVEGASIGGNLKLIGIQTCWLGVTVNRVGGNVIALRDQTGDPDGNEIAGNVVGGNMVCFGNSPAAQFGDSHQLANTVSGRALGECAPPLSTLADGGRDRKDS
ncbi:MAG: hypothetical protein ACP5PW_01735 [Candidatus Dormibacteria bacterium]